MESKVLSLLFAIILATGSLTFAHGQTVYSGQGGQPRFPVALGVGMSNFDLDYGRGRRMDGITASLDTDLPFAPGILRGVGLEVEGRNLGYFHPAGLPKMRQRTILGGATYTWAYAYNVRPVAKLLLGVGNLHYPLKTSNYAATTNMVMAPAAGLECRLWGPLWVRGDYEYQFWPDMFRGHSLTPNGFTVSTVYDRRLRTRNRY